MRQTGAQIYFKFKAGQAKWTGKLKSGNGMTGKAIL